MLPIFLIKIACLNLIRSWRATLVLSLMVVSAVAALVFLASLAVGTNDAMIRNSTGLFSGHIAGSMLREGDLAHLPTGGVERMLIRRQLPVLLAKDEVLEPLMLIGIDPVQEREGTAFWQKTVVGRYPRPGEETIFVGTATADRLALHAGDTVTLKNRQGVVLKTLEVAGLYKTGLTHLDQGLAFCPVGALPEGETALSVAVFLHPGVSSEAVAAGWRQAMPSARFAAWPEFMPDLKQLIDLEYLCMGLIIVLVFAIVAVGISCAFLIFTLKNLREHGIMKAMGLLSGDTVLLLVTQIGVLTFFAAGLGTLAGVLAVAVVAHTGIDISAFTSHNQYFAVSGMLYPRLTGPALLAPPCVAVVFGLAAAIWPGVYITGKNPADILRSV